MRLLPRDGVLLQGVREYCCEGWVCLRGCPTCASMHCHTDVMSKSREDIIHAEGVSFLFCLCLLTHFDHSNLFLLSLVLLIVPIWPARQSRVPTSAVAVISQGGGE